MYIIHVAIVAWCLRHHYTISYSVCLFIKIHIDTLHPGVHLSLKGRMFENNSFVLISDIGESDNNEALQCITDVIQCCASARVGEWYFPSGDRVPIRMVAVNFYRNRGDDGTVNLNRFRNIKLPTGLYCCSIPSASGIEQIMSLCIHVGESTHKQLLSIDNS